jgi:signal transduction histidine kinase
VNSLLNFSRTSASDFADVKLNRIIEETLSLVRHQVDKAGVRVVLERQDGRPPVTGNPGNVQQGLLNLVLNARDALEGGGEMRIRSASEAGIARIEVTDTGHGIPAENLARIYDPFFTTKAARKGTGLGLSVTYGIVQEHGGSIEVRSEIGHGTTFQLEFPLARKPVAA